MKTIKEAKAGKSVLRLVQTAAGFSGVVIANGKIAARIDDGDPEEVWQQLHNEVAKAQPNYFGFDGARARFLRIFPEGFEAAGYLAEERDYKLAAKTKLGELLPLDRALTGSGMGEAALTAFRATNLLSPYEQIRVQEVLRGPNADAFVRAAAKFTQGNIQVGLAEMHAALKPYDAAKWTVVTYLPFFWRPDRHIFLKPVVTLDFASRVGHRFMHEYAARLDPAVYDSLLDLAATAEREIADLKPQDRIDVQSFIWVIGKYTDDGAAAAGSP